MPPEYSVPTFSGPALAIVALITAYLLLVEPFWGRRTFEKFKRDRDIDPGAYLKFFGTGMAVFWGLTGLVALVVLLSPGAEWVHLGLHSDVDWGFLGSVLIGSIAAVSVLTLATRKGKGIPGPAEPSPMLPRTMRERGCAVGVSVTAGVCEEIVFRGLLIAVGLSLGLPLYAAAGLALAIFTFAHLYQGPKSMLGVGLIGLLLTYLYLSSGSLLLPILVHVLIDLRALLLTPKPDTESAERPTTV